jgi:hypothetical protein
MTRFVRAFSPVSQLLSVLDIVLCFGMASTSNYPGLSLEVTITVSLENISKFLKFLRPAYEAAIVEPECTFFEVFIDPESQGVVHWVEGWTKDKN